MKTQTEIAKDLGVSKQYINAILHGKKGCNERIAEELNKYYDITWVEQVKVLKTYKVERLDK